MTTDNLDSLLPDGQVAYVAYYQGRASEYGVTARVDHIFGGRLLGALEAFGPQGRVVELGSGVGTWTAVLAKHASDVTAVEGNERLFRIASERVKHDRVRFVESDLFAWHSEGRYDVVFFTACLSWLPPQWFDRFWSLVGQCLEPSGWT
jgi:protein-L-isoaspartate O-methyltransferase